VVKNQEIILFLKGRQSKMIIILTIVAILSVLFGVIIFISSSKTLRVTMEGAIEIATGLLMAIFLALFSIVLLLLAILIKINPFW
jgi:hypothetical protein